jgi:ABC-type transporter Mla subunit MlaD
MVIGSRVNFQGVPIGVVHDMRFQDGSTLVELRVDPTRASIQNVTSARMDRLLVTGQVTVELEGHEPEGTALPPGSFIQPKEDPMHALTASLPEVVDRAAGVLARIDATLARVDTLLGSENQQHVAAILSNLERATARLADEVAPEAVVLARESAATARAARELAPEVASMVREMTSLAAGLRGPAQTALASFRTAVDDVRGLARQLKYAPDSLLFGIRQPAAPAGGER